MNCLVSLVEVSCNICNSTAEEIISKTDIGAKALSLRRVYSFPLQ